MSNAALLTLAARPNCGQELAWRTGELAGGAGGGETTPPNSRKNSFVLPRFSKAFSKGRVFEIDAALVFWFFFCIFRHSFCELEIERNFRRGTYFLVTSRDARLPFCELKDKG